MVVLKLIQSVQSWSRENLFAEHFTNSFNYFILSFIPIWFAIFPF